MLVIIGKAVDGNAVAVHLITVDLVFLDVGQHVAREGGYAPLHAVVEDIEQQAAIHYHEIGVHLMLAFRALDAARLDYAAVGVRFDDKPFVIGLADFLPAVEHRYVGALSRMLRKRGSEIEIAYDVAVRHHYVVRFVMTYIARNALYRFETAVEHAAARFVAERREYRKTAVLAGQIPVLSALDMIHEGLIVVFGYDAYIGDTAVDHAGKHEIDQTISSAERNGRERAYLGQFGNVSFMNIGEYYT